jgi:hypothetical protein
MAGSDPTPDGRACCAGDVRAEARRDVARLPPLQGPSAVTEAMVEPLPQGDALLDDLETSRACRLTEFGLSAAQAESPGILVCVLLLLTKAAQDPCPAGTAVRSN